MTFLPSSGSYPARALYFLGNKKPVRKWCENLNGSSDARNMSVSLAIFLMKDAEIRSYL